MPAGMRQGGASSDSRVAETDNRLVEITSDEMPRVVEVSGEGDAAVIDVIEPVTVDSAALGLDVFDPAYSPVGVPVALTRGVDGILRADAPAMAARPTRDEVDDRFSAHVNDESPHPAYDDLPDLTLIFENRLV